MTWAARAPATKSVTGRGKYFQGWLQWNHPLKGGFGCVYTVKYGKTALKSSFRTIDGSKVLRCLAETTPDSGGVLCDTRISCSYNRPQHGILSLPLRLKWQGRPHLAKANGVGRVRLCWNLLNASLRTTTTQRSVMTGSLFELSQCRFVWVPHLLISPARYGDCSITAVDGRALVPT